MSILVTDTEKTILSIVTTSNLTSYDFDVSQSDITFRNTGGCIIELIINTIPVRTHILNIGMQITLNDIEITRFSVKSKIDSNLQISCSPFENESSNIMLAMNNIKAKINNISNNGIVNTSIKPTSFNTIVSFIDDDCYTDFITKLKPVYDANGVKCTLASVPYYIDSNNPLAMTLTQLKQLKSEGFEIVSHSYSHADLSTLNDTDLDTDIKNAYNFMLNNGFDTDVLVYPFKPYDERVRNIIKKYHKCAVETTNGNNGANGSPINTFNLKRYTMDFTMIADLKTLLDGGNTSKSWIIFWTHSWDATNFNASRVDELVKYVKSKNIPIMTVGQALPYFTNSLEIGDKDGTYFFASKSGKIETNAFATGSTAPKNLAVYNPSTWADWNVLAGVTVTKDSTGLELTQKASTNSWVHLPLLLKPSTKYGYLFNIVSNTMPSANNSFFLNSWNNAQGQDAQINNAVGNFKFVDTSPASIIANQLELTTGTAVAAGLKIKIKDFRIFELTTGSQIETDFNTLTADQLNTKYPY